MFLITRRIFAVLFVTALAINLSAREAHAQSPGRQSRLMALQQRNALLQQQAAVQSAVQQTNAMLLSATDLTSWFMLVGAPSQISFQLQQDALQIALQQTTYL